jgi:hypothetical protein
MQYAKKLKLGTITVEHIGGKQNLADDAFTKEEKIQINL